MRITKFAHACLLVEEAGVCLLTDPGFWNSLPEVESLDAILITHTHQDHLDIAQVKALLEKHPNATVIPMRKQLQCLQRPGFHTLLFKTERPLM